MLVHRVKKTEQHMYKPKEPLEPVSSITQEGWLT